MSGDIMKKKKRKIIGVVAAQANEIEQRQLIKGISQTALAMNYDTAVISNIYSPTVGKNEFVCENRIFDLLSSDDFDAIIIISESFLVESLKKELAERLSKKSIPIINMGTYVREFDIPGSIHINTSDELDIEDIANHLIEHHGFTDIDMLTGTSGIEASQLRVNGYRRALEAHGIAFDEKKVHYGDFWMTSGIELAHKYADGTIPLPEAILCANDYMAYGLIDTFSELGVSVPEDITIVGYEYVGNRMLHTPILSTYQRNRIALGKSAVNIVHSILNGSKYEFTPPKGNFVNGESCSCGLIKKQYIEELKAERIKKDYEFWNLFNPLDQKLTECRTIEEFCESCGKFFWQVRNIGDIVFCLRKNWYESEQDNCDTVSCRSIIPGRNQNTIDMSRYNISELVSQSDSAAVYYFTPLFFSDRLFGHIMLKYNDPDGYDDIFRNWTKTVSNGLEFLRMKNDIKYLTECQNLSEQRDTLTGMLSETGIRKSYDSALRNNDGNKFVVMLRIGVFDDAFSDINERINAVLDVADAVRQFCGSQNICGRISDSEFMCIVSSNADEKRLTDTLSAIVTQHNTYISRCGLDSFLCCAARIDDIPYSKMISQFNSIISSQQTSIAEMRTNPHYREMLKIRTHIYMNPQDSFDSEKLRRLYPYSSGHLREIYKKCFGVSIHKDCIAARISKAQYCLSVTPFSMAEIAEKCGYVDYKYFLRQFLASVGVTPNQYRNETI